MPAGGFADQLARDRAAEVELAALYRSRVGPLIEDLYAQLGAAFPAETDELGNEFAREVQSRARQVVGGVFRLLAAGEPFEVLGPVITEVSLRRREQLIPQETLVAAYRFLQLQLFDRVAKDVEGRPDSSRLLAALSQRQLEFQWMVYERVSAVYGTAPDELAATRDESGRQVVDALIGHGPADTVLADHAERFGLLLPFDRVAVSLPIRRVSRPEAVVRTVARSHPWAAVAELDGRVVLFGQGAVKAPDLVWGVCALPESVVDDPDAVLACIARAAAAADVAGRLGRPDGHADDLAPLLAVAALPPREQESFLRATFGDLHLDAGQGTGVLDAVAAWSVSANRREAAERLHVHPNTLDARLTRFRESTGLDLTDPLHRMRCDLGLFLLGRLH